MMKNIKWKHYVNYIIVGIATIIFTILSLTGSLSSSSLYALEKIAIAIILTVSLSLVVGFLGELSLGHAGFMCIGAYLGGKAAVLLEPVFGNSIMTLLIALIIGALIAALFGFVIGLPALRLKGDYLAIVTLAFGEITRSLFMNSDPELFGGTLGLETPRFDRNYLFIIAFIILFICLIIIQNIIRSKHGRAITAIRDNEIAARSIGINVTKYKLMVFIIAAFFAGMAGVLYSFSNYTIQSSTFDYNYSIEILVMVVLGGMGNITGSILSATFLTILDIRLQTILTGDMAVLQDVFRSLILIVFIIYNNAERLRPFREKYNVKSVWQRITMKKKDPNKDQDDEHKWDRVPTKIKMDEILTLNVNSQEKEDKDD